MSSSTCVLKRVGYLHKLQIMWCYSASLRLLRKHPKRTNWHLKRSIIHSALSEHMCSHHVDGKRRIWAWARVVAVNGNRQQVERFATTCPFLFLLRPNCYVSVLMLQHMLCTHTCGKNGAQNSIVSKFRKHIVVHRQRVGLCIAKIYIKEIQ